MSDECAVQVGIRVRPFNDREKKLGATLITRVQGNTTILECPPIIDRETGKGRPAEPKPFTFDASFWSHDGFVEGPDGYMSALPGSDYADQRHVFNTFGSKVLDNAWEGYHCCLFAYGQTGSGKSYSMVGYGANKGIVPISCEEIFRRIKANPDPDLKFEVLASMVEIYNEQVQDLLIPAAQRPKKGLDIHENKQLGIYIDGVRKRPVDSYEAIAAVMDEGTENRTVGSTLMNATSSRAHTVITIEFKQVSQAAGQQGCKLSLINLVDLAGSEKAGQTGASGDRLKEGCAINKSLSALGNVIEKLADRSTGKAKPNVVIPYRDSKLTRLLQNALGGSSKTVMICAISPASSNYEETLSTLRYADRAKRIKNAAVINENPQDKLIRQLREENNKLREMMGGKAHFESPAAVGGGPDDGGAAAAAAAQEAQEAQEAMLAKQAEIKALEEALTNMSTDFQQRLKEAQMQAEMQKKKEDLTEKLPHIANLNEDQLLTNKLRFALKEGRTRIGKASQAGDPEVVLSGPGICEAEHAVIVSEGARCVVTAASREARDNTFVNGASLAEAGAEGVALAHGDRLAFGQSLFFFVDPRQGKATQLLDSGKVSYEMARKELAQFQAAGTGPSEEELRASRERAEALERRVREAEEAKQSAKAQAESLMRQREEEFAAQMMRRQVEWEKQLQAQAAQVASSQAVAAADQAQQQAELQERQQAQQQAQQQAHAAELARLQKEFEDRQHRAEQAAARRIEELEQRARKAAADEEDHRQHEQSLQRLEEELTFVMPLVKEANLICAELKRPYLLEPRMHCEFSNERAGASMCVRAAVLKEGARVYEWTPETLENRLFLLRELLEQVEEEGFQLEDLTREEDPLWDPIEPERLIGSARLLLECLLQQVDNQFSARIISPEGNQAGTLRLGIGPLSRDGAGDVPDSELVEKQQDLLGSSMAILVEVKGAEGLPADLANDVRVDYNYFIDEKPYCVGPVHGHGCNPEFGYQKTFVQDPVTSRFLEYLQSRLVFRVYGRDARAAAVAEAEANQANPAAPGAAAPDAAAPAPGPDLPGALPEPHAPPEAPPREAAAAPAAAPSVGQVRRQQEASRQDAAAHDAKPGGSKACLLL